MDTVTENKARIVYKTLKGPRNENHPVVSRGEWLDARRELLEAEKALTRQRDAINEMRRRLPWVRIDKAYEFETPDGRQTLADLFDGRSQLIVYHFMFGPGWEAGCTGCSFLADHFDGARLHLLHRDVTLVAVSRAAVAEFQPFKERMGWRFPWVSSRGSDFNYDFDVAWTQEQVERGEAMDNFRHDPSLNPSDEGHGISVFYKDDSGVIFHTYSTYGRGGEEILGAFMLMDLTPKGRNEATTMDWIRHHDRYDTAKT
jgi:predicted dithiol-disulfide oxidoreductase (DUF899 family)